MHWRRRLNFLKSWRYHSSLSGKPRKSRGDWYPLASYGPKELLNCSGFPRAVIFTVSMRPKRADMGSWAVKSGSFSRRCILLGLPPDLYPTEEEWGTLVRKDCTAYYAAGKAVSFARRKCSFYQGEITPEVPNILQGNFHANSPNPKWLADLTEFALPVSNVYFLYQLNALMV